MDKLKRIPFSCIPQRMEYVSVLKRKGLMYYYMEKTKIHIEN